MGPQKTTILKYTLALTGCLVLSAAMVATYISLQSPEPKAGVEPSDKSDSTSVPSLHQPISTAPLPTSSVMEKNEGEISRLKNEQAKLSKEVDQLRSNLEDLQDRPIEKPSDTASEEVASANNPEEEEESINAAFMAQVNLLDDTIENEPMDPGWSNQAIVALQENISQNENLAVEVLDINCRSSLCRMEVILLSETPEDSIRHFQDIVPWSGEMFFQAEDQKNGVAIIYISRENNTLPRFSD